jgi:hypothetical protein
LAIISGEGLFLPSNSAWGIRGIMFIMSAPLSPACQAIRGISTSFTPGIKTVLTFTISPASMALVRPLHWLFTMSFAASLPLYRFPLNNAHEYTFSAIPGVTAFIVTVRLLTPAFMSSSSLSGR